MVTLKEALKNKLSKKDLNLVPSSFDIIGTIALFSKLSKELKNKEKIIAKTLIDLNKNIKTVVKKTEKYSGRLRLQKVKIIAGEKTKETIHKENNVTLKLNIETCYFSPRSGSERLRIAKLVKNNESILTLFSGIAPFPLTIERNSNPKEIYAIELNKECHKYAKENLLLNKSRKIILFQGDVKKVLPKIKKKFDRIIIPLPKSSKSYLDLALKHSKKNTVIHFYDFSKENEFPQASIKKIEKYCKIKLINAVKCGNYSPYTYRVCIDFRPLAIK
ncbi:MAG: hypothetical protein V1663_02025 [archaeon]